MALQHLFISSIEKTYSDRDTIYTCKVINSEGNCSNYGGQSDSRTHYVLWVRVSLCWYRLLTNALIGRFESSTLSERFEVFQK